MSPRRVAALVALALFAYALAACAAGGPKALPPPRTPVAPPSAPAAATPAPAAATPAPTAATPASAKPAATFAAPDTVPSAAARAVLATIPEPLAGEPASAPHAAPARADSIPPRLAAAHDNAGAPADTAGVPVPAAVQPLGSASPVLPPTPPPPAATAPVVTPPPAAATPAAAVSDTCWRVQVGAPAERARGTLLRDASQSLLLVPMTEVHEAGRWKIRTRDCLSRTTAESLRDRAVASGFKGVFLVRFVEKPEPR